jgi:hypothetical protein
MIHSVAIYPALGIARIGNSEEYFLASDVPGKASIPDGGFKDGNNKFKKQVPRFRIYALDEKGNPTHEITSENATIEWRVHLANRKASWYQFNNAMDMGDKSIPSTKRNGGITGNARKGLTIDGGVRTISGVNQSGPEYKFDSGHFLGKKVMLGEIRTDDKGRLLVFGGDGVSKSIDNSPPVTFANNDGWHDDISDGTVRATVTINGAKLEAAPAMVACTPPNFAPALFPVVSMYDVAYDLFVREGWIKPKKELSFYEDIYPIFFRMSGTQWVNEGFFMLFGTNSPSDFTNPDYIKILSSPDKKHEAERRRVFNWFRSVDSQDYEPQLVPPHYGDLFGDYAGLPHVDLSVTRTQYSMLEQWADGDFVTGAPAKDIPFDEMTVEQQTNALLCAPLEECLGGPFHPGIEITWPFRHLMMWEKPFRLKILPEDKDVSDDYGPMLTEQIALMKGGPIDGSGPGSLTRWLGVPWQTDEASCLSGYDLTLYLPLPSFWSVRVPNTVLSEDGFDRAVKDGLNDGQRLKHFAYRVDWLRDINSNPALRRAKMVTRWHQLGVVAPRDAKVKSPFLPAEWWVETERVGPAGEDPTLKQVKYAEHDPLLKRRLKAAPGEVLETAVPDEGIPRQSRPLQRLEL